MPRGVWSEKEERMYEHVKDSTGSKRIAAATVNKHRSKTGKTKKGDDVDAIAERTTIGKSLRGEERHMSKIEHIFKSDAPTEEEQDEEASLEGVEKAEASSEESSEESSDETAKSIASLIDESGYSYDQFEKAMHKMKGVGHSPKGEQDHGEGQMARTAAKEEKEGFSSGKKNRNGKPRSGTKTPSRAASGPERAATQPESGKGKTGGHTHKAFGQSSLMSLVKSEGLGSDDEIAEHIAREHGVDLASLK